MQIAADQTRVVNSLQEEGKAYFRNDLGFLSLYGMRHLKPVGDFGAEYQVEARPDAYEDVARLLTLTSGLSLHKSSRPLHNAVVVGAGRDLLSGDLFAPMSSTVLGASQWRFIALEE